MTGKVLTICQPWAALVMSGAKRVENRSWPTTYRGLLWIHAGASRKWLGELRGRRLPDGSPVPAVRLLTFGAVLGHVTLVDCVPIRKLEGRDPWAFGPWCWLLADPVPLVQPYACKGALSLWTPPAGLVVRSATRRK